MTGGIGQTFKKILPANASSLRWCSENKESKNAALVPICSSFPPLFHPCTASRLNKLSCLFNNPSSFRCQKKPLIYTLNIVLKSVIVTGFEYWESNKINFSGFLNFFSSLIPNSWQSVLAELYQHFCLNALSIFIRSLCLWHNYFCWGAAHRMVG